MGASPAAPVFARAVLVSCAAAVLSGCVPYAVGETPRTVPEREVEPSATVQIASARRDIDRGDRANRPTFALSNEARLGLDDVSDVGVRLTGFGLSATYKRRLSGAGDDGLSLIAGGGVVGRSHLHWEATVVGSGALPGSERVVPYYGARAQGLVAFSDDAADVSPAVGGFLGARIGWPDLALTPELGVFYSPSPTLSDSPWIVVPSVTVRGERLVKALGL